MPEKLRVLGSVLGKDEFVLDVEVVEINLEGKVILKDVTDGNPAPSPIPENEDPFTFAEDTDGYWVSTLSDINRWQTKKVGIKHSKIDNADHQIWSLLSDLYDMRNDNAVSSIADKLDTNAEDIVKTMFETMEGENDG